MLGRAPLATARLFGVGPPPPLPLPPPRLAPPPPRQRHRAAEPPAADRRAAGADLLCTLRALRALRTVRPFHALHALCTLCALLLPRLRHPLLALGSPSARRSPRSLPCRRCRAPPSPSPRTRSASCPRASPPRAPASAKQAGPPGLGGGGAGLAASWLASGLSLYPYLGPPRDARQLSFSVRLPRCTALPLCATARHAAIYCALFLAANGWALVQAAAPRVAAARAAL